MDTPQHTDAELADIWAKRWADTEAQRIALLAACQRAVRYLEATDQGRLGVTLGIRAAIEQATGSPPLTS